MTSTIAIGYGRSTERDTFSGSGNWAFDNGPSSDCRAKVFRCGSGHAESGLTCVSPSDLVDDVPVLILGWMFRQPGGQSTMAGVFQPSSRRRISPLEARRIALEILQRAEAGRARAAEAEAERGVNWEETA